MDSYYENTGGIVNSLMEEAIDRAINGKPPSIRADMVEYLYNETKAIVDNKELMQKIKNYKFDGAILDGFILARFFGIIPHHFEIPIFTVTDSLMDPAIQPVALPSYSPNLLAFDTEKMSFTQRLSNFVMYATVKTGFLRRFIIPAIEGDTILKSLRKSDDIQHWDDIIAKSDLFVIARNHMVEYAVPEWPNTISVHSITVRPGKPLTEEFEKLVASHADKKIVYISFGSLGDKLPIKFASKLLDTFEQMKDVFFIWSYKIPKNAKVNVPSNVKIVSWAPQNDLLSDERISAFVTHGGNNGQTESVYHGKPMLCIPLFAEQPHNGIRIHYHKYGRYLRVYEVTPEKLESNLREVLSNKIYFESVQRASKILKSQPVSDMKRVTSKITTIVKYGGDHLKSYGQELPFYQYFLLDVVAFLFVSFLIITGLLGGLAFYVFFKLKDYFQTVKKQKDL